MSSTQFFSNNFRLTDFRFSEHQTSNAYVRNVSAPWVVRKAPNGEGFEVSFTKGEFRPGVRAVEREWIAFTSLETMTQDPRLQAAMKWLDENTTVTGDLSELNAFEGVPDQFSAFLERAGLGTPSLSHGNGSTSLALTAPVAVAPQARLTPGAVSQTLSGITSGGNRDLAATGSALDHFRGQVAAMLRHCISAMGVLAGDPRFSEGLPSVASFLGSHTAEERQQVWARAFAVSVAFAVKTIPDRIASNEGTVISVVGGAEIHTESFRETSMHDSPVDTRSARSVDELYVRLYDVDTQQQQVFPLAHETASWRRDLLGSASGQGSATTTRCEWPPAADARYTRAALGQFVSGNTPLLSDQVSTEQSQPEQRQTTAPALRDSRGRRFLQWIRRPHR